MIRQALLDMDGVITNFVKHTCKLHGRPDPYAGPQYLGRYNMAEIWGMQEGDFWGPCGFNFWSTMEFMPDAEKTIALLETTYGRENVGLLTAPCATPGCIDGKREWVKKHLSHGYLKRMFVGSDKHLLASPWRLLVDDRSENVTEYQGAGGPAFLVPRAWNCAHDRQENWHQSLAALMAEG